MNYSQSISYLYGLQKFGIKLGLHTIRKLLRTVDQPHKKFQTVHIAGTNGKGSTAAFLASVLTAAGYKTGLYTSPHLSSFTERIKVNNRPISKQDVVRLTELLKNKSRTFSSITYFEVVTAMAFLYFAERKVDIAIVEVGMGGRLDATNVISPLISIITTISKEHEFYLGSSLQQIAREKAGIIKRNSPVITGVTQPSLIRFLQNKCKNDHCELYRLGKDFSLNLIKSNTYTYNGRALNIEGINLGLLGDFQVSNASLALAAIELLRSKSYKLGIKHIIKGLKKVDWPARLEVVNRGPLVILDGAHNPDAMNNLHKALVNNFKFKRLILVLGIMEDKNIKKILREIVQAAFLIVLCRPRMERAASTAYLESMLKDLKERNVKAVDDARNATRLALSYAHKNDLICITGSLFTVGEVRGLFVKK
jgi:dihydrofolate synthase/folylpolyglutamate synthase